MRTDVIVYTRYGCGPCQATKAFLAKNGIAFTEQNVDEDAEALERFSALGYQLVPVVVIKEDTVWPWGQASFPGSLQETLRSAALMA